MNERRRYRLYKEGYWQSPNGMKFRESLLNANPKYHNSMLKAYERLIRGNYEKAQLKRDLAINRGQVRRKRLKEALLLDKERERILKEQEKARLLRRSNRVRRFRNTSRWFVSWTPTILIGFLATMFFGGLTSGIITVNTTTYTYADATTEEASELTVDIFEYDYTKKLQQLGNLVNIFDVRDLSEINTQINSNLTLYPVLLQDYYDKGYLVCNYTESNDYDDTSLFWSITLDETDSYYSDAYQVLTKVYSHVSYGRVGLTQVKVTNAYYCANLFKVENDKLVPINQSIYNSHFGSSDDSSTWLQYVVQFLRIIFVYPFTILRNLFYDLGVLFTFVFVW